MTKENSDKYLIQQQPQSIILTKSQSRWKINLWQISPSLLIIQLQTTHQC